MCLQRETISIAAYNVEKTIDQCLSSFLTSKYLDDIELLVINDGSTDKTAEIVSPSEYPCAIALEWGINSWKRGVRRKGCVYVSVCVCVHARICTGQRLHISLGGEVRNDQKNANSIGKESWWASRDRNLFFKANIPPTLMQSPQIGIFLK